MTEYFMNEALNEAKKALQFSEVPIGAVVVKEGRIVGRGHNSRESEELALAHAEINAIRDASKTLGTWRLTDCDIYVTIEPCPMCTGAIYQARIRNIYFGATDEKAGACGTLFNLFEVNGLNHYCNIHKGILEEESRQIIKDFFKRKRK